MHQNWTAFMFHWGTVSCSSVDVCFWWPTEHRGEAEFLLGSYCEGPWGPWRNQPRLCSCTTLWISVTSPWELKGRVVCLCSRQVGRWTAERLPKFIFSSGFATGLEDKGSQKTQSKNSGRRWWRALVEDVAGFWTEPLDRVKLCSQVLTGSQATVMLIEFRLPAPGPALSYLILLLFFCPLSGTEPKATWTSVCNTMG